MRWKLRMGREVGLTGLGNRYVSTLPTLSVPCSSVHATRKEGSGAAAKTGQWQSQARLCNTYRPSLDPAVKRQTDILTQPSDTGSRSRHDDDDDDDDHCPQVATI
ncbi:hypothetical protein CSPX01_02130 [Colletotrichum filicis]|nr:hypothetical protein CSPX01_02130 [Colletotrichum filicis]